MYSCYVSYILKNICTLYSYRMSVCLIYRGTHTNTHGVFLTHVFFKLNKLDFNQLNENLVYNISSVFGSTVS